MTTRRQAATITRGALASLVIAAIALGAMLLQPAGAASVTGITLAKFGSAQVFDVQRSPAYPTCTDATTFSPFTVSSPATPLSDSSSAQVDLGTNYLMIQASGDATAPWAIAMFNSSGDELRWSGSAWITATQAGGAFTTQTKFAEKGQIYGAGPEGFLHEATASGYGTFFSPNTALTSSATYTPIASYNDCISGQAIGAYLQNLPVNDAPIGASTTTTTINPGSATMSDFLQPVDMPSTVNTTKAGSTVPIKFRVTDGGTVVSDTSVVESFAVERVTCSDVGSVIDQIEATTTGATSLRYDAAGQQFVQNWKTPTTKGACYRVTITITSGVARHAYFRTT